MCLYTLLLSSFYALLAFVMHRLRRFEGIVWWINGVMHAAAAGVVEGSWYVVRQSTLFPSKVFGGIVAALHGYTLLNGAYQRA